MITELLVQQGSFTIPLKVDTPYDIWEKIGGTENAGTATNVGTPGHIVITPQELDPLEIGGASVLAAARYTGVITRKRRTNRTFSLSGAGLVWWLQTPAGLADIIQSEVTLSGSTLDNALTQLLPASITKGTVTEPGFTATSTHHYVAPLEAIRTVMAETHSEFRINPDGTMDAGFFTDLFNIDTPTVVASRDQSGSDPNYVGIPVTEVTSTRDYSLMATGGILFSTAPDGTKTLVASAGRSTVERDLHGNTIIREFVEEQPAGASTATSTYVDGRLTEYVAMSSFSLDTEYYEVEGGMPVGDAWYVWDPPAFVDLSNPVNFRGDVIYPMTLRVVEATWPLRSGMGILYRPSTGTGTAGAVEDVDWINLTRFLQPEATASTHIILRDITDYSTNPPE